MNKGKRIFLLIILGLIILFAVLYGIYSFKKDLPKQNNKYKVDVPSDYLKSDYYRIRKNLSPVTKNIDGDIGYIKTTVDYSNVELYKDPNNHPSLVSSPVIKDIDGDGKTEKIVRYDMLMADRAIQVLYIYREVNQKYELIKEFMGDPYGFARLENDNTITVGRFIPITDGSTNWDNSKEFEITKYNWTKDGPVKLSSKSISYNSKDGLSEDLKILFYDNVSNLTYNQITNSKIEESKNDDYYKSNYEGKVIKWQGKISNHYSQITGIKFCVIDKEHQDININNSCDWFWAFSGDLMNADDKTINPNWDGKWVNYILNYYKVPFNKDINFYNDIYTIQGKIRGVDCGADNKCVPDIDIINITK